MSVDQINTAELSKADLLKQIEAIETEAARKAVEQVRPVVETVVHTQEMKKGQSPKSLWVGTQYSVPGNVTIDGRPYAVTISVKDVNASNALKQEAADEKEREKAEQELANLVAKLAALGADTSALTGGQQEEESESTEDEDDESGDSDES